MRKTISALLVLALLLTAGAAFAAAPEKGSLAIERVSIRGNASWTPESYPEIWITVNYAEYIIEGNENYPPDFLHFAPPQGTHPMDFRYDSASFLDHDILVVYDYYAYDRASYELFLEKAEPENILADGSDGVAMFVSPDSRRARALIDISEYFGKTSKLEIIVDAYSRDTTQEQLAEMIQAETERVRAEMQFETLDGYWSDGVFTSVALHENNNDIGVVVDTGDLVLFTMDENDLKGFMLIDGEYAEVNIEVDSYAYEESKEEAVDITLDDGSVWKTYHSGYTGYASQVLLAEAKYGSIYLTIKIDCEPDAFPALLEEVYALVTLGEQ